MNDLSDSRQADRPSGLWAARACYWFAWTVAAVVTALTVASATWIMPRHAALLVVASAILMTLCGTRAAVILARATTVLNRRALTLSLRYGVPLLTAATSAMAVWTVWPQAVSGVREWEDDTAGFGRALARWGYFTWYQLGVFVLVVLLSAALGLLGTWLCRRWARRCAHRGGELTSSAESWRLAVATAIGVLFTPLAVCGGLEAARRGGMLALIATHGSHLEYSLRDQLSSGPGGADREYDTVDVASGPVMAVGGRIEAGLPDLEIMLVTLAIRPTSPTPGLMPLGRSHPCDRALQVLSPETQAFMAELRDWDWDWVYPEKAPEAPESDDPTVTYTITLPPQEAYEGYEVRRLFSMWHEQGPTLTFEFPWERD